MLNSVGSGIIELPLLSLASPMFISVVKSLSLIGIILNVVVSWTPFTTVVVWYVFSGPENLAICAGIDPPPSPAGP